MMVEAGDYEPASWARGHDFNKARRSYADRNRKRVRSMSEDALLEARVQTQCENPLVICTDVTGSMGQWPEVMFSKLPYLENEAKEYLGKDVEICWAAIKDFRDGDDYSLQARPFAKGKMHLQRLEEINRGGGGRESESYDLAAAYFTHNCDMPNAINPVLIFIGDDTIHDRLNKADAKTYAKVDLPKVQTRSQLFDALKQKFDVWFLQKVDEVKGNRVVGYDKKVYECWRKVVGDDHLVFLPDPNRVVDCIFGILGEATGKRDYFIDELKHRQLKDAGGESKVMTVMTAMRTIHVDRGVNTKTKTKKKKSKKLL